jgi:hypothetical protein
MASEFRSVVVHAKAVHRNPIDGTITLEVEPSEQTPELRQLMHKLVFERREVQLMIDAKVKD